MKKILAAIIVIIFLASSVYAAGIIGHDADEVFSGQFDSGNFTFDGNVGIGTTSPSALLDVQGGDILVTDSSGAVALTLGKNSTSKGSVYWDADNDLFEVSTNSHNYDIRLGNNWMRLKNDGKVGIGTNNPQQRLQVYGGKALFDNFQGINIFKDDGSTQSTVITLDSDNNTRLYDGKVYITQDGDVGIGTSTPGNKLDIFTGGVTSSEFHIGEAVDEGAYLYSTIDSQLGITAGSEYVSGLHIARATSASQIKFSEGYLRFYTNTGITDGNTYTPAERVTIDTSGNVGIGTISPDSKLQVEGRTHIINPNGSAVSAFWLNQNHSGQHIMWLESLDDLKMILTNEGNLGIGTSSPNSDLHVYMDADSEVYWGQDASGVYQSVGSNQHYRFLYDDATVEAMRIVDGGDVGIGTSNPQGPIGDPAKLAIFDNTDNGYVLALNQTHASGYGAHISIAGSAAADSVLRVDSNSGSTSIIYARGDGKVGIGTRSPGRSQAAPISNIKLDVDGNILLPIHSGNATDTRELAFYKSGPTGTGDDITSGDIIGSINWYGSSNDNDNSAPAARIYSIARSGIWTSGVNRDADLVFATGSNGGLGEHMFLTHTGRLGIGTSDPISDLHIVHDDVNYGAFQRLTADDPETRLAFYQFGSNYTGYENLALVEAVSELDGNRSNLKLSAYRGNVSISTGTSRTPRLFVDENGNVGIGTTTPAEELDIAGDVIFRENIYHVEDPLNSDSGDWIEDQGEYNITGGVMCIDTGTLRVVNSGTLSSNGRVEATLYNGHGWSPGLILRRDPDNSSRYYRASVYTSAGTDYLYIYRDSTQIASAAITDLPSRSITATFEATGNFLNFTVVSGAVTENITVTDYEHAYGLAGYYESNPAQSVCGQVRLEHFKFTKKEVLGGMGALTVTNDGNVDVDGNAQITGYIKSGPYLAQKMGGFGYSNAAGLRTISVVTVPDVVYTNQQGYFFYGDIVANRAQGSNRQRQVVSFTAGVDGYGYNAQPELNQTLVGYNFNPQPYWDDRTLKINVSGDYTNSYVILYAQGTTTKFIDALEWHI